MLHVQLGKYSTTTTVVLSYHRCTSNSRMNPDTHTNPGSLSCHRQGRNPEGNYSIRSREILPNVLILTVNNRLDCHGDVLRCRAVRVEDENLWNKTSIGFKNQYVRNVGMTTCWQLSKNTASVSYIVKYSYNLLVQCYMINEMLYTVYNCCQK